MEKNNTENRQIQYILDENKNLTEILKSDAIPVENPIKYRLKNAFEVFVQVVRTQNYWISNYGRCVNNLNHKDKNTFYEHKQGKVHYTVFEIDIDGSRWKRDTTPEILVADTFLVSYRGRSKIWHKDGDESNNWYKNMLYVTKDDYKNLKAGRITWKSLNYEQKYIEYENKASYMANVTYYGIRKRCSDDIGNCYHACYEKTTMCNEWLENTTAFVKWYLEHFYEVNGETMAVDKDLFGNDFNEYSPEHCCILPQGLNTLLANCKKHYHNGKADEEVLPLGVQKNSRGKYYGCITFTGSNKAISLSEWDTAEEAFTEYKLMKQADILLVAARYKESIPNYIYKRLLKVEVKPY